MCTNLGTLIFSKYSFCILGFRGRGGPNRNRRYLNGRQEGDESNERKKNGPPPGLRGKEIGLWYARRGKSRKEKIDMSKVLC